MFVATISAPLYRYMPIPSPGDESPGSYSEAGWKPAPGLSITAPIAHHALQQAVRASFPRPWWAFWVRT